jgi:hypothetical protein
METLPTVALPPEMPLTAQCTAVFVVFDTVAVNVVEAPNNREVVSALTLTLIGEGLEGGVDGIDPARPPHPADKIAKRIAAEGVTTGRDGARFRCSLAAHMCLGGARHVPMNSNATIARVVARRGDIHLLQSHSKA